MKNTLITFLLSSLLLCNACNYSAITPTTEIPDSHLGEIAMIRADPHWGTVVIYNPDICKEIGEACGFFRLHAFAHEHLNHNLLSQPSAYPASQEMQADCWAAKYGKASETKAAVKLLNDDKRNPNWIIHGDTKKRAENITACAEVVGKQ